MEAAGNYSMGLENNSQGSYEESAISGDGTCGEEHWIGLLQELQFS